jgi:hypothetical protein
MTSSHEEDQQIALVDFLGMIERRVPDVRWVFHVPNGGRRDAVTGARMKRAGVRRGVPDLLLPIRSADGVHIGLAIEMKHGKNRTTIEQREWLVMLSSQGWRTMVAYDWQEAAREILLYLGHNPRDYFGLR